MSYSDVEHHTYRVEDTVFVDIIARGGTRRQRGTAIAARARKHPGPLVRIHTTYSETHGFQSATYVKYRAS
jgi:hypothetical protein